MMAFRSDTSEWLDKVESVPEPIAAVLKSYSGLEENQVISHVENVVSQRHCL